MSAKTTLVKNVKDTEAPFSATPPPRTIYVNRKKKKVDIRLLKMQKLLKEEKLKKIKFEPSILNIVKNIIKHQYYKKSLKKLEV